MNPKRFDALVENLMENWEFEELCQYYTDSGAAHSRELHCCVFLADLGKLDELHDFISSHGFYNLLEKAKTDPAVAPTNRNVLALLEVYQSEIQPFLCERILPTDPTNSQLLSKCALADKSVYKEFLTSNLDAIFKHDQSHKTLMYLTYTLTKYLKSCKDIDLLKITINKFDLFKNLNDIRRAYLTNFLARNVLLNTEILSLPQVGYNELHKLLAAIASQNDGQPGPRRMYNLVSELIRSELSRIQSPPTASDIINTRTPRVAVCISGMHRCSNKALELIYENVIQPLNADVFLHTWEDMQVWPGLGGSGDDWLLRVFNRALFEKCPNKLRSKRFFKETFPQTFALLNTPTSKPFTLDVLPPELDIKASKIDNSILFLKDLNLSDDMFLSGGSLNQSKMFHGIYGAHLLARSYEVEHNFEYDFIVRCRPDIGILTKLSHSDLMKLTSDQLAIEFTRDYGPQDQFWYGSRHATLTMASLWEASIAAQSLSPFQSHPKLYAHGLMLGWMTLNNIQARRTVLRRDMKIAIASAVPPDFSAALAKDLMGPAKTYSDDSDYLNFFRSLQNHNSIQ